MKTKSNKRILALDILRGITIAGMIMVNNPGSWGHIYAPLEHAEWIGLTPTDLVFPFFMFIMGISTYISLRKYDFQYSAPTLRKIIRRTVLIYLIGIAIGWFAKFCFYWSGADPELSFGQNLFNAVWSFPHLRILGVMPRLAICYFAASLIAITVNHKRIPYIIATLLIGYFVILIIGNGFAYNETNILSIVDRAILTPAHMYRDNGIDPEGILSTIPAIAHVLLGFCVGKRMLSGQNGEDRKAFLDHQMLTLFLIGGSIALGGWLLSYGCPVSKKIWSPTFVLITCGMASTLLAILIWIIDVNGKKRWSLFFEAFGVNPLFMYVLGGVTGILFGVIKFPYGDTSISIHNFLYNILLTPLFGETGGSLAYAILFIFFNWIIGYQLYKRKIYIKI